LPVKMRVDLEITRKWGANKESRLEDIFKYLEMWEENAWK